MTTKERITKNLSSWAQPGTSRSEAHAEPKNPYALSTLVPTRVATTDWSFIWLRMLPSHRVQFRQPENAWRLDRSHRRGNRRNIPSLVVAAPLCAL